MTATLPAKADARLRRWLRQMGSGPLPLDYDALALIEARRRVRSRAARVLGPLAYAGGYAWLWFMMIRPRDDGTPIPFSASRAWATVGAISFAAVMQAAYMVATKRGDARIAAVTPRRFARGAQAPVRTVIGAPGIALGVVAMGIDLLLTVLLVIEHSFRTAAVLGYGVMIGAALGYWGIRQARTRPALATDQNTLAVDERLRRHEVVNNFGLLLALAGVRLIDSSSSDPLPLVTPVVIAGVGLTLAAQSRWRPWLQPPPQFRRRFLGRELPFYRPARPSR